MSIIRTAVTIAYIFGYMIVHYGALRRGERALAAGDRETARAILETHIPVWSRTILRLAGVRLTVEGRQNLPAGQTFVFVANHRSYFDIPLMLSCLDAPHGLMAKEELQKIPLLHRWMDLLGCVYVAREDVRASVRALNDATETVKRGESFVIFPEGTRYKGEEGGIGEFKNGAFRIALKTGTPLVPVAITGARGIFEANHLLMKPGAVTVRILPPIPTEGLSRAEQKLLPEQVQQRIQTALR